MKQNTKIFIGLALPVVVLLIVVGSVIFPRMFFTPKYDFVYGLGGTCANYNCNFPNTYGVTRDWYPYRIVDGKIIKDTDIPIVSVYDPVKQVSTNQKLQISQYPDLYIYHVATGSFEKLTDANIAALSISNGGSAPDGTVVEGNSDSHSGGLISEVLVGGSRYSYNLYLKNKSYSQKITVRNGDSGYYSSGDFNFLGWVLK